jgi:hypothetical protein
MPTETNLTNQIHRQISQPASPAIHTLADTLLDTYTGAVQAILFYGSCLRTGEDRGGLVDLYVLVDSYLTAYRRPMLAALNKLLPPNVFYLEVPYENRLVRYIWGRFAQPVGLLYARNDQVVRQVQTALNRAVLTFIARALPQIPSPFTARDLWRKGLELSYRAELRAERPHKLVRLFESAPDYYEHITREALAILPFPVDIQKSDPAYQYSVAMPHKARRISRLDWMVRSWQGKMLSVLRLLKGTLTFRGGVDYILWKIERHSGERVEAPPRLKRYPLLAACVILWRLYCRGAYR